jgi:hypothetical protein
MQILYLECPLSYGASFTHDNSEIGCIHHLFPMVFKIHVDVFQSGKRCCWRFDGFDLQRFLDMYVGSYNFGSFEKGIFP